MRGRRGVGDGGAGGGGIWLDEVGEGDVGRWTLDALLLLLLVSVKGGFLDAPGDRFLASPQPFPP